jgi:hypothetical protein
MKKPNIEDLQDRIAELEAENTKYALGMKIEKEFGDMQLKERTRLQKELDDAKKTLSETDYGNIKDIKERTRIEAKIEENEMWISDVVSPRCHWKLNEFERVKLIHALFEERIAELRKATKPKGDER